MAVTKTQLIDLINLGYEAEHTLVSLMNDEERATSGTVENYSERDYLAHSAEWALRLAERIAEARKGAPPPEQAEDDNGETENPKIYAKYKNQPWPVIENLINKARAAMIEQVEALSEEEINDPQRFTWADGPLWQRICGSSLLHVTAHIWPLLHTRGALNLADQLAENEMKLALPLGPSPEWQGVIFYNHGCRLALAGEDERALEQVEKALHLRPQLIEWSQRDTDLVSLHGDPRFLEMLERVKV